MKEKRIPYRGEEISVTYSVDRCIHAGECVRGLPDVFDPRSKPWVRPDEANAERVLEVVRRCPTGALKATMVDGREDGDSAEVPCEIRLDPNGPLLLRGKIRLVNSDDELLSEDTRMALCRCGQSSRKPFCDGTHSKVGYEQPGTMGTGGVKAADGMPDDHVVVKATRNGSYSIRGAFRVVSVDGAERAGTVAALCRCGATSNAPFCDGSHRKVGFEG